MPQPITIPLITPNEPEALLVSLCVSEGQKLEQGDLICTLETTKATVDLHAEAAGYMVGLQFSEAATVRAGDILGYLAETAAWKPDGIDETDTDAGDKAIPSGLRITQPALALAREHRLDLSEFPPEKLITASSVRSRLASKSGHLSIPAGDFDPLAIIIYGGGGHGKTIVEMLRVLNTYRVIGFVDDGRPRGEEIMGLPVLGGSEVLPDLHARGVRLAANAVGGIGSVGIRIEVFRRLVQAGFVCPAVVHPTAFVEASATLSPGVQVFSQAYVGSDAKIGSGSIINTGAILSHDCVLGDCVNISPGAILAGEVEIGAGALVGMGVTVNLQVRIGAAARIGNGATVKADVPENGVVGAGRIWPA